MLVVRRLPDPGAFEALEVGRSTNAESTDEGVPMTTTDERMRTQRYALGRTTDEYERLRAQARVWEPATARLLDEVALRPGARCLDAGCGPGETMRLFRAGIGVPDGTDVAGRLVPLAVGRSLVKQTLRSVVPAAVAHGVTTQERADATLAALAEDADLFADRPMLWPLMVATWKHKSRT